MSFLLVFLDNEYFCQWSMLRIIFKLKYLPDSKLCLFYSLQWWVAQHYFSHLCNIVDYMHKGVQPGFMFNQLHSFFLICRVQLLMHFLPINVLC